MDRRNALKSIALSTGVVISSGSLMNALLATKSHAANLSDAAWQPLFFKKSEGAIVTTIADIILPQTETPGASEVKVPQFIDLLFEDILDESQRFKFISGLHIFTNGFKRQTSMNFITGEPERQKKHVEKTYSLSQEETSRVLSLVAEPREGAQDKDEYDLWSFLVMMREMTITAYYTSEFVGEKVLSYDPVPGMYQPCIPVEEIGNVWSI